MEIVQKVWGWEEILVNEPEYCAKFLHIAPGYQCSLHYHRDKKETFYVYRGVVLLEQRDIRGIPFSEVLYVGDKRTIVPGTQHRFQSFSPSDPAIILEVSTHHEDSDSYRITESGPICQSEKS